MVGAPPGIPRVIAIDPGHGGTDNGTTNRALGTVPAGTSPYAVAVDPDSGDAYVANYGSHPVTKLDLSPLH